MLILQCVFAHVQGSGFGVLVCSVDSLREATESGEGSPQRHPVQSPTHDPRQEVPPQDIQVRACLQLQLCAVFTHNYAGIWHYKKKCMRVLQTMLCWHRAGGLVGATECLCSHPVSCCWHVAVSTRRRGAQPRLVKLSLLLSHIVCAV